MARLQAQAALSEALAMVEVGPPGYALAPPLANGRPGAGAYKADRCTRDTSPFLQARALRQMRSSIFGNPDQFGRNKDLARYPRDEASDLV